MNTAVQPPARAFAPMSARRLLVFGGIALALAGMLFGEIFAIFVLHQNAARIGVELTAATTAVAAGDPDTVLGHFARIGRLLENRGTKVDTHVHIIAFGYLALLLALALPYVDLGERAKKRLAVIFLIGSVMLPVSVFLIYYVGLAYSPLEHIGWASLFADFGGLLVIVATAVYVWGMWRHFRARKPAVEDALLRDRSWSYRVLLAGGTVLILLGFLHGAYYAAFELYGWEEREAALLRSMAEDAARQDLPAAHAAVAAYGAWQGFRAVHIAAHSHIIEFGLLALLLAFLQPFVFLSERWRRRWTALYLAGSLILPVFVLLEIFWGKLAGGIADFGGALVVAALLAMLVGVLRYTGRLDAAAGGQSS